jgi:hypothetical protein
MPSLTALVADGGRFDQSVSMVVRSIGWFREPEAG